MNKQQDGWLVDIGMGTGPFCLGTPKWQVQQQLSAMGLDNRTKQRSNSIILAKLKTTLDFSQDGDQSLLLISTANPIIHFPNWDIIGKPIHKVVRLFKCQNEEATWCDTPDFSRLGNNNKSHTQRKTDTDRDNAALLRSGTLWIPSLGLGFSVKDGKITCLHMCKPEHSPTPSDRTWNAIQQTMSETGIIPSLRISDPSSSYPDSRRPKMLLTAAVAIAALLIVWHSVQLQRQWNNRPDVQAMVIEVTPPNLAPIGEFFKIRYSDEQEIAHEHTLERMQFFELPKLGEPTTIRYLENSPEAPLGPRRFMDVGLNAALPKLFVCFAVYAASLVLLAVRSKLRRRS